ncbi:MAG: hypothetical protein QOI38_533 [Sphingomonadales bacterium]|jgi:hypothetical protein|nr:hypothetical protein [Sphingomonadales bacterium]
MHFRDPNRRDFLRAGGGIAAIAAAVLAGLLALSAAVSQVPVSVFRARAVEAVESGTFAASAFIPLGGDRKVYRYHYNDCLIVSMLVLEPLDPGLRAMVSPRAAAGGPRQAAPPALPPQRDCNDLLRALADREIPRAYYHRYIHGDWIVAGLLLSVLPLGAASWLLFGALVGLSLLTAFLAGRRLAVGGGAARERDAAWLAMSLAFLLFGGVGRFGWSFSFAPSDIVFSGFLLYAWRVPLAQAERTRVVRAAALLGALTAAFEFLIGAAPAGVALLIAAIAFNPGLVAARAARRAIAAIGSYAAAFALTFTLKYALVAALWGLSALSDGGQQLAWRIGAPRGNIGGSTADLVASLGMSPEWAASTRLGGIVTGALRMLYYSGDFLFGSRLLGVLVIGGGPAALVLGSALLALRGRTPETRLRARLLLAAALLTLSWYFVFVSHTIGHSEFMMRPLSWLAIFSCGGAAWMWAKAWPRPRLRP